MVDKFKAKDDFKFDSDLDFNFDSIEPDFGSIKDNRKPVTKFKEATVAVTKDYVKDKNNIVNFMRTAMPEAYGEAFDMVREGNTEIQNLYNSVKDTAKPMIESTKGLVRTALPAAKGILPAKLHKKIEEAVKPGDEKGYQYASSQDSDDARVESLLADIFKANTDLDKQREERENYRETLAEGVQQVRHNDILSIIDSIRKGVTAQVSYQNKVTYNYQKKSLELQYRHFWATAEILKDQKESNKGILEALAAVQKNTALPDYAKLQNKEAFFEQSRNKFISDVRDSLFGGTTNYIRQVGENVRKQAQGMLSNFRAGFDAAEGMGSQVVQQIASADEMGSSAEEEVANFAAPMLLDELAIKGGNATRRWLSRQKGVDRLGQKISRVTSEAPERIEDALTNPNRDAGVLEPLRMIAASLLPNAKADTQLEFTAIKDLNRPTSLTGQDTKTLREVIPGLLARIHREIRIFRTGDTSTPLIGYDFERNRFSNDKAIGKSMRARFGNVAATQGDIGGLIDRVDPRGTLNADQRKELTQELIGKVYGQKSLTFERLANSNSWSGDNAQAFADIFKRHGKIGDDGKMGMNRKTNQRQLSFIKGLRHAVGSNGDPRAFVQEMVNMGQYDMLLRSGMVDDAGRINVENVKKYLSGGEVEGTNDLDDEFSTGASNASGPAPKYSPREFKPSNQPSPSTSPTAPQMDLSGLEKMLQGSIMDLGKIISEKQGPATQPEADTYVHTSFDKANETLLRIEDILLNTDNLAASHYQFVSGDTSGGKSYTSLLAHIKDKASEAAGAAVNSIMGAGSYVANKASSAARRMRPTARRLGRQVSGMARRVKNKALDIINSDVFVGLEEKPRLIMSMLKSGGYIDAVTGKVITSLKDIKGDVKDLSGKVILRAEEIGDAYVGGEWGRKLADIIGSAWNKILGGINFMKNFIPDSVRAARDTGRRLVKTVKGMLPPYDVFVPGREEPVLYAEMFKLGKYRSKKTSKVLKHPRDIDGEVLDEDGNTIVRKEDLEKGLVDVRGGKVSSLVSRLWARGGGKIVNAFKMVKDIGADAFKWVTGKIKDGASFIKNMITGRIDIGIYSKRTSDLLEEIRDFMKHTWGKKKVIGDSDGDGIRDNSLADMANKRGDKDPDKKGDAKEATEKKGGILDKIAGAFAGIKSIFSKKDKEKEDDDDGWGLDDVADLAEIGDAADEARERRKGRKAKRAKRPGRLSRMGRGLGKKMKGLGSRLFGFGRAAGGAAADVAGSSIVRKGMFNTAMPRLLARLGLVGAGAAATAGGGLLTAGSAGASLLGGLGSVLSVLTSWPVAVGVGAGYLGFKVYKNVKKTKLTPLSKVRLAQYGLTVDDKLSMERVFELENMLNEHVTYDGEGWASVDRNKIEPKALAQLFDLTSQSKAVRFLKWYDDRFYPVYTRALSGMKHLKVETPQLSDVEQQLDMGVKEKYMDDLVESCASYHDKMNGPPPDVQLKIDDKQVRIIASEQRVHLRKEEKNQTGKTTATTAVEAASPLTKQSISDQVEKVSANKDDYTVKDKDGNVLKDLSQDELKKALQNGATISVRVDVPKQVLQTDPNRLDALTCIRYKTYGLTTMRLDKVQCLMALEALCAKYLTNTAKGVTFSMGADEILMRAATFFGKHNTSGRAANEWKTWFNERFLPTFLPFSSAVFKLTSKKSLIEGVGLLTPVQQLKLGNMITGQSTLEGNKVTVSVWEISASPWVDYDMNRNPDSVMGNLETIKVLVSKIELKEPLTSKEPGKDPTETTEDLTKPAFNYRSPRSRNSKLNGNADSRASQGMKASGDVLTGTGHVMERIGEAAKVGNGNGKKWSDLPNPTGSGWSAMKDLIIAAAQATGIDPESLAAYIAVESGFDPNAQPVGGNAMGLGQFMPGTWKDMMKNYGAALGVPAGTPRTDARASALFTAMYLKENLKTIGKRLGRGISTAEGYLGHFAGPTGASELLEADGNAIAANVRPAAAASNPNVFYDPKTKRPYTVKEMVAKLQEKLSKRPGEFGVKAADFSGASSSTSVASAAPAGSAQAPSPAGLPPTTATAQQVVANASNGGRITTAGFGNPAAASAVNMRDRQETGLKPAVNVDTSVTANTKATGMPIKPGQALELTLQREPSTDDGTFGVLRLPDGSSFLSLELPWKNNQAAMSCIPPGSYKCSKRQTTKHGFAYEVKNVPGRSGILIHAGATAGDSSTGKKADSQGCILLGLGRNTRKSGQKGITESKAAMKAFYDKMQDMPFTLTVINGKGDEAGVEKNPETAKAVDKITTSAPQPTAALAVSAPITTGPTPSNIASTGQESGLRSALSSMRGNQITPTPVSSGPTKPATDPSITQLAQVSRGFKPTPQEMQVRDAGLVETLTKNTSTTNEILRENLEANKSTAASVEKLVKMLEKANPATTDAKPAAPAQEQKAAPRLTSAQVGKDSPQGVTMRRNY